MSDDIWPPKGYTDSTISSVPSH